MATDSRHKAAISNLATLVKIPTVSRLDNDGTDWNQFTKFRAKLRELYPECHKALDLELVDNSTLLFRWRGKSDGQPAVLMAHYDVVPATVEGWEHPPFGATLVKDENGVESLWGRGTLDDKGSLVCVLEAVEHALGKGFRPQNDVYLSFGHDEEVAGTGASSVVELLKSRNITPWIVVDEGGAVVEGIFPGVDRPIAVVGVSEKGILSLRLTVLQQGGHASAPPKNAATIRLARALLRLNSKPFPKSFVPTNLEMIRTVGKEAKQPFKWVFGNLWLTKLPLLALFGKLSDETRAMIRTTQVVSQLSGAQAANAIPEKAEAVVNIRIAIDSSVSSVVEHVRKAIRDPLVQIETVHPTEPSPVSETSGRAWEIIKSTISKVYPRAIVTPYVMLGASDSRHFAQISNHVYRFSPFEMSAVERGTLHAKNERIRVEKFWNGIRFYDELLLEL